MICPAQAKASITNAGNGYGGDMALEWSIPIRGQIAPVITWIETLNEEILIVEIGSGDRPPQSLRATVRHDRHTGYRGPDHPAAREFKASQHPLRRGGEVKMRVSGQQ